MAQWLVLKNRVVVDRVKEREDGSIIITDDMRETGTVLMIAPEGKGVGRGYTWKGRGAMFETPPSVLDARPMPGTPEFRAWKKQQAAIVKAEEDRDRAAGVI
jgi:hypothetical protein